LSNDDSWHEEVYLLLRWPTAGREEIAVVRTTMHALNPCAFKPLAVLDSCSSAGGPIPFAPRLLVRRALPVGRVAALSANSARRVPAGNMVALKRRKRPAN